MNNWNNTVMNMNTIDPLEITERYAVTVAGAPSYTSAVHRWKGTADSLKAKPVKVNMNANNCNLSVPSSGAISLKLSVPVVPYNIEIPNSKMQEANAEESIIFIADSDDRTF